MDRLEAIKESGCVACLVATGKTQAPDIHHLTTGGRRHITDPDAFTVGLCPYHHRGLLPDGLDKQTASGIMGPSFAWGRKTFAEFFGSDKTLLSLQNHVLQLFAHYLWVNYDVPHEVRRKAHLFWTAKRNS